MATIYGDTEILASCKRCKEKLVHFRAYIPGLGEVCMKCYVEYAQEMENREINAS